jgi:hypothetical protein
VSYHRQSHGHIIEETLEATTIKKRKVNEKAVAAVNGQIGSRQSNIWRTYGI